MKLAVQVDYSGERPGLTKLDLEGASLCRFTVQYTIITIWKGSLRLQCPVQEDFQLANLDTWIWICRFPLNFEPTKHPL